MTRGKGNVCLYRYEQRDSVLWDLGVPSLPEKKEEEGGVEGKKRNNKQ
jgi:hypothetical protein